MKRRRLAPHERAQQADPVVRDAVDALMPELVQRIHELAGERLDAANASLRERVPPLNETWKGERPGVQSPWPVSTVTTADAVAAGISEHLADRLSSEVTRLFLVRTELDEDAPASRTDLRRHAALLGAGVQRSAIEVTSGYIRRGQSPIEPDPEIFREAVRRQLERNELRPVTRDDVAELTGE
ncbi:MAG TPA: hypothetical protein VK039_03465 [Brevibacterium sp.]|nr:hypothetical protein [Brevibacterium sp.]